MTEVDLLDGFVNLQNLWSDPLSMFQGAATPPRSIRTIAQPQTLFSPQQHVRLQCSVSFHRSFPRGPRFATLASSSSRHIEIWRDPFAHQKCALMHGTSSAIPASSAYAREIALAPKKCSFQERLLFVTNRMLCDLGTWEPKHRSILTLESGKNKQKGKRSNETTKPFRHTKMH